MWWCALMCHDVWQRCAYDYILYNYYYIFLLRPFESARRGGQCWIQKTVRFHLYPIALTLVVWATAAPKMRCVHELALGQKKLSSKVALASTVLCIRWCAKHSPSAWFSAGGCSLGPVVAQWPDLALPIATVLGRSGQMRWAWMDCGRVSRFKASSLVGFEDFAPSNPCAESESTKAKPGNCARSLIMGNLQMEGFDGPLGSAGCSMSPIPEEHAN